MKRIQRVLLIRVSIFVLEDYLLEEIFLKKITPTFFVLATIAIIHHNSLLIIIFDMI